MQEYLRLIEFMRHHPVVDYRFDGRHKQYVTEDEWRRFERCRPFVFHIDDGNDETILVSNLQLVSEPEIFAINAPFDVFSIERNDSCPLALWKTTKDVDVAAICIVASELKPGEYDFYVLCAELDDQFYVRPYVLKSWNKNQFGQANVALVVKKFLDKLKTENIGSEDVDVKYRLSRGGNKRTANINTVIHIAPKKSHARISTSRRVNWSHRFEVRGHWRKLEGQGKNRNGEYSVDGFTWVTAHTKGPEDMPLIQKTRIVQPGTELALEGDPK